MKAESFFPRDALAPSIMRIDTQDLEGAGREEFYNALGVLASIKSRPECGIVSS